MIWAAKFFEGIFLSAFPVPAFATSLTAIGFAFAIYLAIYLVGIDWRRLWRDCVTARLDARWAIAGCLATAFIFDSSLRVTFPVAIFMALALLDYVRTRHIGIACSVLLVVMNCFGTMMNYGLYRSPCMTLEPCDQRAGIVDRKPLEKFSEKREDIRNLLLHR